MTPSPETQIDLFAWARELEQLADVNAERASRRGYLLFATNPRVSPEKPGYREVYATEAKTPNQAIAKVRPLAEGRRSRAISRPAPTATSWLTRAGSPDTLPMCVADVPIGVPHPDRAILGVSRWTMCTP